MGYARIVQYGEITEYYEYEKPFISHRERHIPTKKDKERAKERRRLGVPRTEFSIRRAKINFYHLVAENLYRRGAPALVTLTNHLPDVSLTEGYRNLSNFKKNVKSEMGKTVTYIAVPEYQKNGRLHYHVLMWGIGEAEAKFERGTRNLQRLYGKGFVDVRLAYDSSPKLASYLAKYFTKANSDPRNVGRRTYTASRDINRPRAYGSNALSAYANEILVDPLDAFDVVEYNTKYLGRCRLLKYKKQNNDNNHNVSDPTDRRVTPL